MPDNAPALQFEPFPIPEEELLARYEKTYTAAAGDALFNRGYRDIYFPTNILPLERGYKVAGIAFTVKGYPSVREGMRMTPEQRELRKAAMFEEMRPNCFLVWDTSNDEAKAQYGEMMSAATMMRGVKAGLVDGGARDTDRIIEMGFPIWCRYTTPASMMMGHDILDWQIPIRIGKCVINPGDVIFGDLDGVVRIPRELAYEVLLQVEETQAKEKGWRALLASGMSPSDFIRQGGGF